MSDSNGNIESLSDGDAASSPPLTPRSKPKLIRCVQSCGHIPRNDINGLKQTREECLLRMETLEKRIKRYREERDKFRKSFQENEIIKQEETPKKSKDVPIRVQAQGTFAIADVRDDSHREYHKTPYDLLQYKLIIIYHV